MKWGRRRGIRPFTRYSRTSHLCVGRYREQGPWRRQAVMRRDFRVSRYPVVNRANVGLHGLILVPSLDWNARQSLAKTVTNFQLKIRGKHGSLRGSAFSAYCKRTGLRSIWTHRTLFYLDVLAFGLSVWLGLLSIRMYWISVYLNVRDFGPRCCSERRPFCCLVNCRLFPSNSEVQTTDTNCTSGVVCVVQVT